MCVNTFTCGLFKMWLRIYISGFTHYIRVVKLKDKQSIVNYIDSFSVYLCLYYVCVRSF